MLRRTGFWMAILLLQLALALPASGILLDPYAVEAAVTLQAADPSAPVAPTVLEDPVDMRCRPNGAATDQVLLQWNDENDGNADYKVYRQEVGFANWDEIATVAGSDCEDGVCQYLDAGASNSVVYSYRVRADDGNETSNYSASCREPRVQDDPAAIFRAFYRLSECPTVEGKQTCTQNSNDPQGRNIHVMQMIATHEAFRTTYMDIGFKDFAFYKGARPYPIDLYPCNNGCKNSLGIQIPPANLEGADYNPDTGGGTDYEVFVVGHEIFHVLQGSYGKVDDPYYKWLIEGQARSTEDKSCIFDTQAQCQLWDNQIDKYYGGAAASYLGFPEQGLRDASYIAALFWTYIVEQFGTSTDEPAYGMDALVNYWERNEANDIADITKDGIGTLNDMLAGIGSPRRFKDIFQDFAVANYLKDYLTNPPPAGFERYNYIDEESYSLNGNTYGSVKLTTNSVLAPDATIFGTTSVQAWGARYFQVDPDPAVPAVTVEVEALAGTPHSLYYHVVAIEGGNIVEQWTDTGDTFELTIDNSSGYDRLALIVASMENPVNFNYGFNLTDGIFILSPISGRAASVGEVTAPEKFILQLQVLDEDGDPVAGIDTDAFTITVGSAVVSPTNVIASSYIAGQYWLTVRAPGNEAGCTDYCDLSVGYASYIDTEVDAILYGPRPDTDNMIIIDRSGSMAGAKIAAAQDAAKLYADSYSEGDRIGILSFNDAPSEEFPLTGWTEDNRDDIRLAIDGIPAPGGLTANGAALREGNAKLVDLVSPNPVWSMVLLSDGADTVDETDDHIAAYVGEYNDAKKAGDQVPVVHVVAVGDDADGVELSKLTIASGGLFQFLPVPSEVASVAGGEAVNAVNLAEALSEIYRVFAEDVLDEQQVHVSHFTLATTPQPRTEQIQVDEAASQAIFVLKYSPANATLPSIFLIPPSGTGTGDAIAPTLTAPGHLLWRIPTHEYGKWRLTMRFGCGPNCPTDYLVEAALVSDLTLKAFLGLPVEERLVSKPMPIVAFLSDVAPLTGATMTALSERTGELITLHDDGMHGDGAANDGAYGGTLLNTNQAGGYNVVIDAAGNSPFAGDYTRRVRLAFYMEGTDTDKDRLPDWWEEEHGTDPTVNDANKDPDGDGLPNAQEYIRKTHPLDPDTDDGGENDGSEVNRGANPLLPDDDGIELPTFKPWPAPGRAILRLFFPAIVESFTVERATSISETFSVLISNTAPVTQWVDLDALNDQSYCYRIISKGDDFSSTSPIQCTTPKSDPHPPHGVVTDDYSSVTGAATLAGLTPVPRTLRLLLDASDDPSSEEHPVFDGEFLFADAQMSGVAEMMIANRADFAGAEWEPYRPTKVWTLAPNEHDVATVFVLFRDAAGNVSDVAHETFVVDPDLPPDDRLELLLPSIENQPNN